MKVGGLLSLGAALFVAALAIVPSAGAEEFVPGEILVRYAADSSPTERSVIRRSSDVTSAEPMLLPRAQVVEARPGQSVKAAIVDLESNPAVLYAEPNYIRTLNSAPANDPLFSSQWALSNAGQVGGTSGADIDALRGWDLGHTSRNAITAVIDTGIALDHPDLSGELWKNPGETPNNGIDDDGNGLTDDVMGWDFIAGDKDPTDGDGHGTHVAGIIGATGNNGQGISGVSQAATLMPLRACGAGGGCTISAVVDATVYAVKMGARVVNMSFGSNSFSQVERDAIAAAPGVLFVAGAGNDGTTAPNFGNNEITPKYPCQSDQAAFQPVLPNLICVASSDRVDNKSPLSNFGANSVDLAAPGDSIVSTYPTFQYFYENSFDAGGSTWDYVALDTGGVAISNRWERNTGVGHEGSPTRGVTDSYGSNYLPGSDATMTMAGAGMNLAHLSGCRVDYWLKLNTEQPIAKSLSGADVFYVEASASHSGPWTRLVSAAGTPNGGAYFRAQDQGLGVSLHQFDGKPAVYLRFGLRADPDASVGGGASVDDVNVSCAVSSKPSPNYVYLSGTSMASPQVAGIASIVRQLNPGLSAPAVKAEVLGGVDPLPAFSRAGPTPLVTGGRANLRGTLERLDLTPPQAPSLVTPLASGRVGNNPIFKWDDPDPLAQFDLVVDDEVVASGIGLNQFRYTGGLAEGGHKWMVIVTDTSGNVARSETRSFRYAPPGTLRVLSIKPYGKGKGGSKVRVAVSGAGRVRVVATAKSGKRKKVVAKTVKKVRSFGEAVLIVRPTAAGRRLRSKKIRVKAKFRIRFVPAAGGRAAVAVKTGKLAR